MGLLAKHLTKRRVAPRPFMTRRDVTAVVTQLKAVVEADRVRAETWRADAIAGKHGRLQKWAAGDNTRPPSHLHVSLVADNEYVVSYPREASKAISVIEGRRPMLASAFMPAEGWVASVTITPELSGGSRFVVEAQNWVTVDGAMADREEYEAFIKKFATAAEGAAIP